MKLKKEKLLEIAALRNSKKVNKPISKEVKTTKVTSKYKEYSFDIKKVDWIFDQLI